MPTEDQVRSALTAVKYPGFKRDIISFGLVKSILVDGATVAIDITVATRDESVPRQIHEQVHQVVSALSGVRDVKINFDIKDPPSAKTDAPASVAAKIPGVKQVIAVASGKGGVGKSTVAANLAVALAQTGARVGLCDCDLYGPSVAHMFGTSERPYATDQNEIIPIQKHGVQLMSMGFLLDNDSPVIVRGPVATRYIQQFLRQCAWDNLDYLILDLPPGTGDIQLTIVQTVALAGAVIVTTPQEVALIDARKAISMFEKVNVPILGILENMSYFQCPSDGKIYHIFGQAGGEKEAKRLGVPLIAQIPIDLKLRENADAGTPTALAAPSEDGVSEAFFRAATHLKALAPA